MAPATEAMAVPPIPTKWTDFIPVNIGRLLSGHVQVRASQISKAATAAKDRQRGRSPLQSGEGLPAWPKPFGAAKARVLSHPLPQSRYLRMARKNTRST